MEILGLVGREAGSEGWIKSLDRTVAGELTRANRDGRLRFKSKSAKLVGETSYIRLFGVR